MMNRTAPGLDIEAIISKAKESPTKTKASIMSPMCTSSGTAPGSKKGTVKNLPSFNSFTMVQQDSAKLKSPISNIKSRNRRDQFITSQKKKAEEAGNR